ncbi:hypothetical protein MLD52_22465 [Puniceicoccaceae bacterium K14]|nr:hypothetical protein [Puniceicoccaceae bacterium K14]
MAGDRAWHVDVWYRSAYGLYKGDFFNDKLSLLAGYRYDEYFTRAQLWDRFDENAPIAGFANYAELIASDDEATDGADSWDDATLRDPEGETYLPIVSPLNTLGYSWEDPGTFGYNFRAYDTESEYGPGDSPSSETSVTLALNYDITDALTVYTVSSGGVTPNIGLLDGNLDPHPSEITQNLEIGLKFELFDGKLSGTISAYEITRENAVWEAAGAPRPSDYGGSIYTVDEAGAPRFDAPLVQSGAYPINYGVHANVFDEIWKDAIVRAKEIDPSFAEARPDLDLSQFEEGDYGFRDVFGNRRLSGYTYDENGVIEAPIDTPQFAEGVYERVDEWTYLNYNDLDAPLVATHNNGYTRVVFSGEEYRHEVQPGPGTGPAFPDVNIYYLPIARTFRDVLETAYADRERSTEGVDTDFRTPEQYTPLYKSGGTPPGWGAHTSRESQTDVLFTDIATGYDLQLIYQPTKSWQFTFSYAHTEREAQGGFQFVDAAVDLIDPVTGVRDGIISDNEQFGTQYDSFARIYGRESFGLVDVYHTDDDGNVLLDVNGNPRVKETLKDGVPVGVGDVRASEANAGIDGLSLYYGFEDSASFVQKYTFQEGFMKNFSVSVGVIYQGPANTSIAIGGRSLAENLYPTPPTKERIYSNMNLNYSWRWGNFPIKAALRISNLGNDTHSLNTVVYENVIDGSPEVRRTEKFYAPRSFRFNLSTTF